MNTTLKIGRREYRILKQREFINHHGQSQTYTDLVGARGADVTLVETHTKHGTVATLIHFGRMSPRETVDPSTIHR